MLSQTLLDTDAFSQRHIAPNADETTHMLQTLGYASLDAFTAAILPKALAKNVQLDLPDGLSEAMALQRLRQIAQRNLVLRNFIGQGYYGTQTPTVIVRTILENPAWYTAYTPYQAEISQGRMEALLNFQTVCVDLTQMEIANASLLDEPTAAAEAMQMAYRCAKLPTQCFYVHDRVHPQTHAVLRTRAEPLGIVLHTGPIEQAAQHDAFAVLIQYPDTLGHIGDMAELVHAVHARGGIVVVATDLLALTMISAPGEWGADIVVGSSQRFGVPLGFGGPHAAFIACRDLYKRALPGRLIGVSIDAHNDRAYRLALQTREQHIRREKATSNICTAQVLLAIIASMYAVYHGPDGLLKIAQRIHRLTCLLASQLQLAGLSLTTTFFDTLHISGIDAKKLQSDAWAQGMNIRYLDPSAVCISIDECTTPADIVALSRLFGVECPLDARNAGDDGGIPQHMRRKTAFLQHPVFHTYHSEHAFLRYVRALSDRDLALDRTMIPLGSCTMKLNATTEMIPITWPEFAHIHPFAPQEQWEGYRILIADLQSMLAQCTGYDAVSVQPNSGAQGEYAGLLAIRAYHRSRGQAHRCVCLIPASAHGTNPASAHMAGMRVVTVACDAQGNLDCADLEAKALLHADTLAALMMTYPSTHGVFEDNVVQVCAIVHHYGGLVYTDGANMNALVGLAKPGLWGSDVSHLNLHKTFCIPHGGGGPGVGPCAVKAHLAPFLPAQSDDDTHSAGRVSGACFGSAGILPITWMYITMMGARGLRQATQMALLHANYIAHCLADYYPIMYTASNGRVAHEFILDIRPIEKDTGITAEDIAKRLIDYGFHAPTVSFPVSGTLMIEPTESEPFAELTRFITAMIHIRHEITAVQQGRYPRDNNPLKCAPHTAHHVCNSVWEHPYTREVAAFPLPESKNAKYWPPVARVNNVYGDRHLFCTCPVHESEIDV